jgi:hypothetical protein
VVVVATEFRHLSLELQLILQVAVAVLLNFLSQVVELHLPLVV